MPINPYVSLDGLLQSQPAPQQAQQGGGSNMGALMQMFAALLGGGQQHSQQGQQQVPGGGMQQQGGGMMPGSGIGQGGQMNLLQLLSGLGGGGGGRQLAGAPSVMDPFTAPGTLSHEEAMRRGGGGPSGSYTDPKTGMGYSWSEPQPMAQVKSTFMPTSQE